MSVVSLNMGSMLGRTDFGLLPPLETASQPETIAEGPRLPKRREMRDSSLSPDCVKTLNQSFSINGEQRARILFSIRQQWSRLGSSVDDGGKVAR
jgi:hypothetical protein